MNLDLNDPKWANFAAEIDLLGAEMRKSTGRKDYEHLRKLERWGRIATILGYLTAWIFPNPISALFISQGIFARWSLVLHPISHGALDRIPGIPARYTSRHFAKGHRRLWDWLDWMTPENWHLEHNQLHHYQLGTEADPDVVMRNAEKIRTLPVPRFVRYLLAGIVACIWKPFYYAPNTVMESRHHRGLTKTNRIDWNTWNPMTPEGRELWLESLLPYALVRFVLIPILFLPLGLWAVFSVFVNSLLAELLTNLHSFFMIGPNHTGDDVYTFENSSKSRTEFYLRQIVGSINFRTGSDWVDFPYGGMNYQIEHHLWPKASLLQCQRVRPKLKALCEKYEVRYIEAALLPRVAMTFKTMAGACSNPVLQYRGALT